LQVDMILSEGVLFQYSYAIFIGAEKTFSPGQYRKLAEVYKNMQLWGGAITYRFL